MSALPLCRRLQAGALVRVPMAGRHHVAVTHGRVWATAMGNPVDYVIEAGESAIVDGPELIIEALAESCVSVTDEAEPQPVARSLHHAWARP